MSNVLSSPAPAARGVHRYASRKIAAVFARCDEPLGQVALGRDGYRAPVNWLDSFDTKKHRHLPTSSGRPIRPSGIDAIRGRRAPCGISNSFSQLDIEVRAVVVAHPSGPRFQSWLADGYIVKATGQVDIQGSGADVSAVHEDVRTRGS